MVVICKECKDIWKRNNRG